MTPIASAPTPTAPATGTAPASDSTSGVAGEFSEALTQFLETGAQTGDDTGDGDTTGGGEGTGGGPPTEEGTNQNPDTGAQAAHVGAVQAPTLLPAALTFSLSEAAVTPANLTGPSLQPVNATGATTAAAVDGVGPAVSTTTASEVVAQGGLVAAAAGAKPGVGAGAGVGAGTGVVGQTPVTGPAATPGATLQGGEPVTPAVPPATSDPVAEAATPQSTKNFLDALMGAARNVTSAAVAADTATNAVPSAQSGVPDLVAVAATPTTNAGSALSGVVAAATEGEPTTSGRPAQVANQMATQLAVLRGSPNGAYTMTMQITPDDLGPVSVQVTFEDGKVDMTLRAALDVGRDTLVQAAPDLRRYLEQAGLSCNRVEVDVNADKSSWFAQPDADRDHEEHNGSTERREQAGTPSGDNGDDSVVITAIPSPTSSGVDLRM